VRAIRGALVGLALVGGLPALAAAPPPQGNLLLNGGGGLPDGYWSRFLELAGGAEAPIVVLPTASERPEAAREPLEELAALGATAARALPLRSAESARAPEIVAAIRSARGVFLTGGDARRLAAALVGTPAARAIAESYARGGVVGGTSAGAAALGDPMLSGTGDFTRLVAGSVEREAGLGLLPEVLLDQHFVARQRQNRLLASLLERPDLLGVGIDERTVLWVRPDGTFEVFGEGWVEIYDASTAIVRGGAGPPGAPLAADGVRVHLLIAGDRFDPGVRARLRPPS